MRVHVKYVKFSFFTQNGPVSSITESPKTPSFNNSVFWTKIFELMRNMQNFHFAPRWPSTILSITESSRTSSFDISVFQIKICKFRRDRQNFHFPLKTAQFRFLVLYVIFNLSIDYISVLDKDMPNFTFLPKVAHYCVYSGSQGLLGAPYKFYLCFGNKYRSFGRIFIVQIE